MLEEKIDALKKAIEDNTTTNAELVKSISNLLDYVSNNEVDIAPPASAAKSPAKEVKKSPPKKAVAKKDNVEQLKPAEKPAEQNAEEKEPVSIDDLKAALVEFVKKHNNKDALRDLVKFYADGASLVPEIKPEFYSIVIEKTKLSLEELEAEYKATELQEAA